MSGFLLRGAVTLALFLALAAWRVRHHYPTLPNPLTLDLMLDRGEPGRADPLIVGGRTGAGDFLSVRFEAAETIRFLYDSWGHPALVSERVRVQPGAALRLQIAMPALDQVQRGDAPASNRVSVTCNGANVLDARVHHHLREPAQISFGENRIGGTACGPTLRGRMSDEAGRPLRGDPATLFAGRVRVRHWVTRQPWQPLALLLLSIGIARGGRRLLSEPWRTTVLHAASRHRWFLAAAAGATIFFAWLVTLGSFRFDQPDVLGTFYDFQTMSLLEGRLDVPEEAIGGEAFEARGKFYGYFGPTPALLRLPFVIVGTAFGNLSRAFMVAYFFASLVAAYLILCDATKLMRRHPIEPTPGSPSAPSPCAALVLVGSAGLGSTLFFLGSHSFVFHEAILCGIAFALWSGWCALRHLHDPWGRWWLVALVCGLLALHARPPAGLFALALLGCTVLAIAGRDWRAGILARKLRRHAGIALLCAAGLLTLNSLAYLKFRTFDAAPLHLSRPYADPARLAYIEGKSFHAANLPYNFYTYLVRPNVRLESRFPWLYLGTHHPGRDFPRAKIDLPDHTLALPFSMPSLFALATLGSLGAWLGLPGARAAIGALWAAVVPVTLALFAAIATAQRYTGDFCPFLICAAAHGLAAIDTATPRWRRALMAVVGALTVAAIAVTVALTVHYQGDYLWSVPEATKLEYAGMRRRVDGFFGVSPP